MASNESIHGEFIDRQEARRMADRYRQQFPKSKTESVLMNADLVRRVLNQKGCVNLKMYLALNAGDELTLVLAPADAEGNRIPVVLAEAGLKDGEDRVLNRGTSTPPPSLDL